MALAAVAAALLLSAAWLGQIAPLLAQEGVGIAFDDLSSYPTETGVDRFYVQLTNLDADVAYQVIVSSDNAAAVGVGACRTSSQTRSVTGVEAQDLRFFVHACAVAPVTLTAEVRAAGADTAAATVSQALTVLAFPEGAPVGVRGVPATRGPTGRSIGGRTHEGRPGIVPSISFDNRRIDSVRANWGLPNDNGHALTGYGVLFWKKGTEQPDWGDADTIGVKLSHTFTGLEYDTTYKFRIHACHEDENRVPLCGHWTDPPREVSTAGRPDRPHTINFTGITANSARVTWRIAAETGGVPLTGFDIKYWPYDAENQDREIGAKTHPADDGNDTGETLTGLAAGTAYEVKLRACNGPKDSHCSDWSDDHQFTTLAAPTQPDPEPTPDPTPPVVDIPDCGSVATGSATAPTDLNVIPLSGHQALLTWTGTTGSIGGYTVDLKRHGSDWPAKPPQSPGPLNHHVNSHMKPCLTINLANLTMGSPGEGLHISDAYDVRVRAHANGTDQGTSETITIIDTPITKADGHVPDSAMRPVVGQADLTWASITGVLSDQYANGDYILRRRRLSDDSASRSWRPSAYHTSDIGDTRKTSATSQSIGGLAPNEVYAIQLIYLPDNNAGTSDTRVFSGRNVYVWPSATQLLVPGSGSGTLFAGSPVWSPVASTTYAYSVCTETFTRNADTMAARDRRQAWVKYIVHAFDQWELASNTIVNMNYLGESCTDYSPLVRDAIVAIIQALMDEGLVTDSDTDEHAKIEAALETFIQSRWYLDVVPTLDADSDANEVMMFDNYEAYAEGGLLYFAFTEAMSTAPVDPNDSTSEEIGKFGNRLGFVADANCWGRNVRTEAVACADPSKRSSGPGYTTDIVLLRTQVDHDPLAIPGGNETVDHTDVRFNRCPDLPVYTDWLPKINQKNSLSVYGTLVHEAGHALGLGHPERSDLVGLSDTVMALGSLNGSYKCSPHPLDVLTVYALHRSRQS